jgi:hypothetical protein
MCSRVGAMYAHSSPVKGGILAQLCPWLQLCKYWPRENKSSLFRLLLLTAYGSYAKDLIFTHSKFPYSVLDKNKLTFWQQQTHTIQLSKTTVLWNMTQCWLVICYWFFLWACSIRLQFTWSRATSSNQKSTRPAWRAIPKDNNLRHKRYEHVRPHVELSDIKNVYPVTSLCNS